MVIDKIPVRMLNIFFKRNVRNFRIFKCSLHAAVDLEPDVYSTISGIRFHCMSLVAVQCRALWVLVLSKKFNTDLGNVRNRFCVENLGQIEIIDMVKEKPNSIRTYDKDGFRRRAACLCFKDHKEEEVRLFSL